MHAMERSKKTLWEKDRGLGCGALPKGKGSFASLGDSQTKILIRERQPTRHDRRKRHGNVGRKTSKGQKVWKTNGTTIYVD